MITARAPNSAQATLLPRTPSPVTPDRSDPVPITQLPPIHKMLHPESRGDVTQRRRGSTLPSYAPSGSAHVLQHEAIESDDRVQRKERSSTVGGRPREDCGHGRMDAPNPPEAGISLPPIHVGDLSQPNPTFRGLPSIKTMLPSPSHMISFDSRSPVSPRSPQSMIQSSSSWSSHTNTSTSGADIAGRFQREQQSRLAGDNFSRFSGPRNSALTESVDLSATYEVQHRREASPSHSPPPSRFEEGPANLRSREIFDDSDVSNGAGYNTQHQIQHKPGSSSLLTLTAPRRPNASTIPRRGTEREYGSDSYFRISRSREAIPEDSAIASTSASSIIFPSSAPSAGRKLGSHLSSEYPLHFDASRQPARPLAYEANSGSGATAETSENDANRNRQGETSGGKKRRSRATQEQLDILNGVYSRTPFPTTVERTELAQQLGMTPRSVQIWFQNKRQGAKNNENRRRELPPLSSTLSSSPQMPNLVPLALTAPSASQSPPSPTTLGARSVSNGAETWQDPVENGSSLRGRARRRRMSVNDLLSHDSRDDLRSGISNQRHGGRQRSDEKET